ncbi:CLUMA_CG011412, isoform A [Clunio marinus]|uniref:CLUMA_CG011412, isoform A n=1 Tax=Clunio marinus TaxID=568069 RepID=A0A1J1ICW2_9DIPT|nr:CLUMA_CG011412, isoform A [Clunio marinus]
MNKRLDETFDYEASGEYFEVTVNNYEVDNISETTTKKSSSSTNEEASSDDGVTCSQTNITDILAGYDLENHVLVIFKVNVTSNERELVLFLNLAKRFAEAPSIFLDQKFIVITSDHSSDIVLDFIEKEDFPSDIVVIDEDDFSDFGFVIDLDELHAYVVDQCGKLTFIVVPPWSSAQHPYVKAATISTIIDLPCACPSELLASNIIEQLSGEVKTEADRDFNVESKSTIEDDSTIADTSSLMNIPVIDIDTDEVENIEDLLDNSNNINHSHRESSDFDLPLRIIIPSVHMHFDNETQNYWKYEHIVMKTDNYSYHDHLQNGERLLKMPDESWKLENITNTDLGIFVGNRSFNDILRIAKSKQIFFDRLGKSYRIEKEHTTGGKFFELLPIDFDVMKLPPVRAIYGVRHHYEQRN